MKALLVGLGAVGARSARQLLSSKAVSHLVVFSRNPAKAGARLAALGGGGALTLEPLTAPAFSEALTGAAVTLLTTPGPCRWEADASLAAGVPVVSTSDDPHEVRSLLALGPAATSAGIPAVVGAGMAPGLSCLLAAWAAALMDEVTEIHVASLGTGGPACREAPPCRFTGRGRRMAGRSHRPPCGRVRPRAGLVPRQCRCRLLPGEPSRPSASYQGLPRAQGGHDESGGLASRPVHVLVANVASASPGRNGGCPVGRGPRAEGGSRGNDRGRLEREAGSVGRCGGRRGGRESCRPAPGPGCGRVGLAGQRAR